MNRTEIIDLSQTIENNDITEFQSAKIKYINHRKGAFLLGLSAFADSKLFFKNLLNIVSCFFKKRIINSADFPDKSALAWEEIKISTHTGTHLDAPWHFGPQSEGKPAKTIDKIPLNYCYSDGVLLDLSVKPPKSLITSQDLKNALNKINYTLKENDIVLIRTSARKFTEEYRYNHPGFSSEAVIFLLEKGVKIIGTDGWGMDRPAKEMIDGYLQSKDKSKLWPAHLVGRIKEYWHIEKLTNLDKLPKAYGFKIACFPIKIRDASAAWCRVVAIM